MSGSEGFSMARTRGENRFYVSPAMRKQQQQQQQKKQQSKKAALKNCAAAEMEKRAESDQCGSSSSSSVSLSSNSSVSSRDGGEGSTTNLDRFLEYTTPVVPAQFLPKVTIDDETLRLLVFC
uniref:Uncharacterized protein LOC105141017 isoform X2 n=1 Tax=Rhizophora mucronata TaxID=61149 RepID=A0A2P2L3X7_RHIMU